MAMVISPRSKIVTLTLLIGIITLVALIITGVIGIWSGKSEKSGGGNGTKMVSSKLQQITGYAAMQHVSKEYKSNELFLKHDGRPLDIKSDTISLIFYSVFFVPIQ